MSIILKNFQGTMTSLSRKNKAPETDHIASGISELSDEEFKIVVIMKLN
jgi:hypothetical protein